MIQCSSFKTVTSGSTHGFTGRQPRRPSNRGQSRLKPVDCFQDLRERERLRSETYFSALPNFDEINIESKVY